jgi:hypothetical protein
MLSQEPAGTRHQVPEHPGYLARYEHRIVRRRRRSSRLAPASPVAPVPALLATPRRPPGSCSAQPRCSRPRGQPHAPARYPTSNVSISGAGCARRLGPDEAPVSVGATSAATLSVAIHLLHALSAGVQDKLAGELLDAPGPTRPTHCTAVTEHSSSTASATATPPTNGSRSSTKSPSRYLSPRASTKSHRPSSSAREAVRWLSASIVCIDEDSRETTAALAHTLARSLGVCVFAAAARTRPH